MYLISAKLVMEAALGWHSVLFIAQCPEYKNNNHKNNNRMEKHEETVLFRKPQGISNKQLKLYKQASSIIIIKIILIIDDNGPIVVDWGRIRVEESNGKSKNSQPTQHSQT